MRVWLINSGSSGNAALVDTGPGAEGTASAGRILVDAGIGPRVSADRLRTLGVDLFPRGVDGIVVTHHHADHIAHLEPLARALRAPIYLHDGIAASRVRSRYEVRPYPRRGTFNVGPFVLRAEPVPHDAPQVALSVAAGGLCFGFATDLGRETSGLLDLLAECDEALLEANYCDELLHMGPYTPQMKGRIQGPVGHLSNEQTRDVVAALTGSRLARVWLGHLSLVNNTPSRAVDCVRSRARRTEVAVLLHGQPRVLRVSKGRRAMTQLGFGFAS